MTTPTCACGQPVDGTTLCRRCVHTTEVALANIPAYTADAELSAAKRKAVRYDLPRGKGGTKSPPSPVDGRYLRGGPGDTAVQTARNTIVTWVRVCLDNWPPLDRLTCTDSLCKRCSGIRFEATQRRHPRDTIASCCAYLQRMLPRIAGAAWAEEFKRAIVDAERGLYRVDARGPERIYAGLCTVCLVGLDRTPLYALPGDEYVTCPADDCGMTYHVEDRRNLMRDALEFEWMTAARIADLSSYLQLIGDREWVRKKINRWHFDGTLRAASVNAEGEPMFPFGEVSRLLLASDSQRTARRKQQVS